MLPQPLICVADVEQTSAWFQRILGFVSAHGGPEYEQLRSEGALALQLHRWDAHVHPHLGNPAIKPYGNGVVLWFMSERVESIYERAVKAGGEVLEPLHVNRLANHLEFSLREPNGYVVVVAGSYGQLGSLGESVANSAFERTPIGVASPSRRFEGAAQRYRWASGHRIGRIGVSFAT